MPRITQPSHRARIKAALENGVVLVASRLRAALAETFRPLFAAPARGPGLGVVAVLSFCAVLLFAAVKASDRYYQHHLVPADTSYYLSGPAILVSGKDDFGLRRVMKHLAPLPSSDGGTTVYVLQTLAAWYLRDYLPLRPAMAVFLNATWLIAMALSLYAVFWSRMNQWTTAALGTVAYLVANPYMPTVRYGISSMDPNLVAFMLGTSALCWALLSEHFTRFVPCLLVGAFLGLLCLGRVYSLGVVLPAMFPTVLACFWRRSIRDVLASTVGGATSIAVALTISGWFFRANWAKLLAYPTQFGDAGVLAHVTFTDGVWQWLRFPRWVLAENLMLTCVLSWPLAAGFFAQGQRFLTLNWAAIAAALAPLLILAKMGTTFEPYGAICLFGLFMAAFFPFKGRTVALLHSGRFAAALSVACAVACWNLFGELRTLHDDSVDNKRSTIAALQAMREHAASSRRKRIKVGLVHYGTLHDASLVNALVMDMGFRVATPGFQPKRHDKNTVVVDPLMPDPWAWSAQVVGAAAITPEIFADRVTREADYVLVLAGDRRQDRRVGRWPTWVEASELIRKSRAFERLGPLFHVPSDGTIELLVRSETKSPVRKKHKNKKRKR